jgi:hypothetical protein
MKWIMALVALATMFLVRPTAATVVEIPLHELEGAYTSIPPSAGQFVRFATVHLPAVPSSINSVSLHLKGTATFANYSCDGSGGYGPPSPVPISLASTLYEGDYLTTQQWASWDQYRDSPGTFDITVTYGHYPEAVNWSFFLDGSSNLVLNASGVPPIFECNLVGEPDQTTFTEVTLIVDGEFPTPAPTTSWGAIKASYR